MVMAIGALVCGAGVGMGLASMLRGEATGWYVMAAAGFLAVLLTLLVQRLERRQLAAVKAGRGGIARRDNIELTGETDSDNSPYYSQPWPGTFAASIDDPYGMAEPDRRTQEELLRVVRPKRPWILTRLLAVLAFVIGLAIPLIALHDEIAEALCDLAPGIAVVVFPGFEPSSPAVPPSPTSSTPEAEVSAGPAPGDHETPSEPTPEPSESPAEPAVLHPYDEQDLATILAEIETMAGTSEITELNIYDTHIKAQMPISSGSDKFDDYQYHQATGFEHIGPSPIQPRPKDQKRFDLAEVKPAVVADVLRKAPKDSGFEKETPSHVIVSHLTWGSVKNQTKLRVYIGDDYGNAMLYYDTSGKLLKVHK
ncbi:hypothetical protein [uncultured Tessaracoccus sp.]|uniref:hypothetical protein n=1 Tax=uncultured Tessaracoccus sp. TaxID=905023 RepID=UPI00260FCB84|nr:hypothetical protein [uncultured Tessaracoccus sp.]